MAHDSNPFDVFSAAEANYSIGVLKTLSGIEWAAPLLKRISDAGGVARQNRSLLFEARFANALHEAGIIAQYEIPGEGQSTLDFGFIANDKRWTVELMRLEETAAAVAATHVTTGEQGVELFERSLSTAATQPTQSEEGETLKAVQRICQKCESDGVPHKFPVPTEGLNAILVDFRTFLFGGDEADRLHVALGGECLRNNFHRRYWNGNLISGVFSPHTEVRGAETARERVHFLGFVNEKEFAPGSFAASTVFVANPNLFDTPEQAQKAIATWPLQPARIAA